MTSALRFCAFLFLLLLPVSASVGTQITTEEKSLDQKIDESFKKLSDFADQTMFKEITIGDTSIMWIILWLATAGIVFTIVFGFVNLRSFSLALRTVRGKYSNPTDPGQISHFQALAAAVSGTVGLGNIAGVAIGIAAGGPGVAFWLFVAGFLGMSTKFAECTLGVKYREIDPDGTVRGGAMYYLRKGFAEKGLSPVGMVLSFIFAICCIFASWGGGNIFQVNQTTLQLVSILGPDSYLASNQWSFGLFLAILTGLVIIGGIKSIAKVTDKLVPLMCLLYVVSALIVIGANIDRLPAALTSIFTEAFHPRPAIAGGMVVAFIWGIRRASFSNEAGIGSAPIAHSVVKTRRPASEGVVALLEPFLDTVVICTLTALVLVITMQFKDPTSAEYSIHGTQYVVGQKPGFEAGIRMTSLAFESVSPHFKYVLFVCVFMFAFSTLITWSFYGLLAWQYLFGKSKPAEYAYKLLFCCFIVIGASASMDNATKFSDGALFAMSVPNLIGVYFLIPVVKKEYREFLAFTKRVDSGEEQA